MILVCAADDFRKFRKIRKIINFKIHKKSVTSKMSSVWCFLKTALKTLIFFKKLIFTFLNQKIIK